MLYSLINLYAYARHPRLVVQFRQMLGFWPNIALPADYHEKMLWKRVFDRDPLMTELSDKIEAKTYVTNHYPELPVAGVLWSGTDASEIPDSVLDGDVFVKANHGSGFNIRVTNQNVDRLNLERQANGWLHKAYGRKFGEWGYRDIDRRIFVEETMKRDGKIADYDFKFYISGGIVCCVFVLVDRFGPDRKVAALDRDGQSHPMETAMYGKGVPFSPPAHYKDMVRQAELMSKEFDAVRIDFIADDEQFYFGEYTFYPMGGFDWPQEREHELLQKLSQYWDLRKNWFMMTPRRGLFKLYARSLRKLLDDQPVPA